MTYLSHFSLLFLQGSQLIAFLARFGAGGFTSALWLGSASECTGECGRLCFMRGCEDEIEGERSPFVAWCAEAGIPSLEFQLREPISTLWTLEGILA